MIKRILYIMLVLALLTGVLTGCGESEDTYDNKTNIVVVLDTTDSMNATDPGECAKFSAAMLLSAFDDYKIPILSSNSALENTAFGLVTFGADAEEYINLETLGSSDEQYDRLREKIYDIKYDDMSGTNFYAGFNKAVEMCEANPASRNIIYVLSDGQIDIYGSKGKGIDAGEKALAEEKAKQHDDEYSNASGKIDSTYTIYTVGINTEEKDDSVFEELGHLTSNSGNRIIVHDKLEITDVFAGFIEDIYKILNPNADSIMAVPSINNGVCEFELDKRYKTVQILLASESDVLEEPLQLKQIKSPKIKEAVDFTNEMSIKGSKITVRENSGIAVGVYIENAKKGQWKLYLNNEDSYIIAKVFVFNPFPWGIVISVSAVAAVIFILLIMWLFYIPPVHYRKKAIPGYIDLDRDYEDSGRITVHEDKAFLEIMHGRKYFYKGNITLGTILNDKKYKNIFIIYRGETDLDEASLEFKNTKDKRTCLKIYSDSTSEYTINENEKLIITWKC